MSSLGAHVFFFYFSSCSNSNVLDYSRSEQYSEIQLEFLDVYRHYHLQLPAVAQYEEYPKKISYLIDEMGQKFEKKNPYMVQFLCFLMFHFLAIAIKNQGLNCG